MKSPQTAVFPALPSQPDPTLTAWVAASLAEQVKAGYHPKTVRERTLVLGWLVAWCAAQGVPGRGLDRPQIARFQQALAGPDGPQGPAPLPYARQATSASHLRRFGRFLVAQGHLERDPCGAVVQPRLSLILPGILLTPAQVVALLDGIDVSAAHGLRDRALVEVAYATGAPSDTLARIQVADLTPAPVHPHRVGAWLRLTAQRSRQVRSVPLGERAWAWVDRYRQMLRPVLAAREFHRGGEATALFLSQWGHPLHNRDITQIIAAHLRRAGLPTTGTTRILRHSLAVHLIDAGCDLRMVAAHLGHADFSAMRRYARSSMGLLRDLHARFHPAERGVVPDVGRVPFQASSVSPVAGSLSPIGG